MNSSKIRKKAGWVALFAIVAITMAAPFSGYWLLSGDAVAASSTDFKKDENPRSSFWRSVRQGTSGYSAVSTPEANVLIQNGGQNWRALKKPIAKYGSWAMALSAVGCLAFFLLHGSLKLDHKRSGLTVPRWSMLDRTLHWVNAILFIVLAITGMSLTFGRTLLIPIIGKDVFAAFAGLAKTVHDFVGPAFGVVLLILLLKWVWMNIPTATDVKWLLQAGGMFTDKHVAAGKTNGGEKMWFWVLFIFGLTLTVTGFLLDFPNIGTIREDMQTANLLHSGAALILVAAAIGHVYIGTIGSEGSLEGMTTGRVDVVWAKQHHDLWYDELMEKGVTPEPQSSSGKKTASGGKESTA